MKNLTDKAREVFANDLYATQATGVVIEFVEPRSAICSVKLNDTHRNAMGAVMGGVMFTLADLAFAIAANSQCLEEDSEIEWVSLGSNIQFISQPKSDTLQARTECIKQGQTTCVYHIIVSDTNGRTVSIITTTGIRKPVIPY